MQPNPVDNAVTGTLIGSGLAWLIALAGLLVLGYFLFSWRRTRARSLAQRLQRPDPLTPPSRDASGAPSGT